MPYLPRFSTSFLSALVLLMSSMACTDDAERPTSGQAVRRTFISNSRIETKFAYEDRLLSAAGVPSAATVHLPDGATIAMVQGGELVDEDGERRIRVTLTLSAPGAPVSTISARFTPGLGHHQPGYAGIKRATVDGKWDSVYIYDGPDGRLGIPRIETYDSTTNTKVAETRNVRILGNGVFSAEEIYYQNGKEVFSSITTRHAGTGLMIEERVQSGALPLDYHHYELVLGGWPMGR